MRIIEDDGIYSRSRYIDESEYDKYILDNISVLYFHNDFGYIYKSEKNMFGIRINSSKDLLNINMTFNTNKELLEQIDSFNIMNILKG